MRRSKLIFIRGLNTHPQEGVYLGPLNLGPADRHLKAAFEAAKIPFGSILDIGSGQWELQVEKAKDQLRSQLQDCDSAYLLGHSQGGLIARVLANDPEFVPKLLAVTTIATPHLGSRLADAAMELKRQNPFVYWSCRLGMYDTETKLEDFRNVSVEQLKAFNQRYPLCDGIPHFSLVCSVPFQNLPLSLKMLPRLAKITEATDGMVPESSQAYGEVLGRFELDHLSQLGYATHINPASRARARQNFAAMIGVIINSYRKRSSS